MLRKSHIILDRLAFWIALGIIIASWILIMNWISDGMARWVRWWL